MLSSAHTSLAMTGSPAWPFSYWPAAIEIALARGDLDAARNAVEELESIAAGYKRPLFEGGALMAKGELLLGEDRPSEASPILGRSWRLWMENDLPYEQISRRVHPWSYKDFEGRPVDVTPKLERAMRQNPHLKVHVAYGYYDGATPHFAAEDVLAHLQIPAELRANIEHAYYPAGHMMYVHEPTRRQQSSDIAAFVTRSTAG